MPESKTTSALRQPALRGWYSFEVIQQDGQSREFTCPNLVTQQGRDNFALLTLPELLASCALGVGQLPASDEQIKLSAAVGLSATASNHAVQSSNDSDTVTVQYVFPEGTFDNVDLSEVGVFDKNGKLFSRALLKNQQGNLEPITVQKTQRVVVTYSLQIIRPEAPIQAQLQVADMGGLLHVHTLRVYPQTKPRYAMGASLQEFGPSPASMNLCTVNLITDPTYAGVPGTVAAADREVLPAPALVLEPYSPGTSQRQFSVKVDSQYGNKASGMTGLEVVHPTLGVMLSATVEPAIVKTTDFRFYFDLALDW